MLFRSLINTRELGQEFARAIGNRRACLMRGHGITTVGDSIEEAGVIALGLNELATMNYHASLLGDPRPISPEDQAALQTAIRRLSEHGSTAGEPGPSTETEWRYYCRLADEGGSLE